jgi:hypothetical protein
MLQSDLHSAGMESFKFFDTMVNPEDLPPMRIPDSHSAMSAVIKTPFIQNLPYSGIWNPATFQTDHEGIDQTPPVDGYSEVIAVPGTTDCYFYTLGADAVIWTAAIFDDPLTGHDVSLVPILATHPDQEDVVAGRTQITHGLQTYNTPTGAHTCCLPKPDSMGHSIFEMRIDPINTVSGERCDIFVGFFNKGVASAVQTTAFLTANWSDGSQEVELKHISSTGDDNTANSGFYVFPMTLPANDAFIKSIFMEVSDTDEASDWRMTVTSAVGTNEWGLTFEGFSACSFAVVDAPELNDLSQTRSERTTALSVLCTYQGADLQNGGQVAAARLGMALSPLRSPNGEVYQYLSSLPFYKDDYALRDGIYAWWLPDSIQEHFYRDYRQPRSDDISTESCLQVAMFRDNPNQTVRLKIIQNFEFVTRSRLYASKTGPNNPAYHTVIGALKVLPAVTKNGPISGFLAKAFNLVKTWVAKPDNWVKLLKGGASVIQKVI